MAAHRRSSRWPARARCRPAPGSAGAGAVAVLAGAGFVVAERRAPAPLLPLAVLRGGRFRVANVAALIMNLTSNGLLFLLTRYLQSVRGVSALTAGLMLLPLFVPLAV